MRTPLLAIKSYYSLLRASVSIRRWCEAALGFGYDTVALADTNFLGGAVDFFKTARELGVYPILGAEILTANEQVIFLIKTEQGYQNLCRLISARHLDLKFDLIEFLPEVCQGLICICHQCDVIERLKPIFAREDLFAHPDVQVDVEPIAWRAFTILEEGDITVTRLLMEIRRLSGDGAGPPGHYGFNPLLGERQWAQLFQSCPRALDNAKQVAKRCEFDLLGRGMIFPRPRQIRTDPRHRELARLCHRGAAQRYTLLDREIVKRLESELHAIEVHGFSDYFLVVYEIVQFAKAQGIPVEVRGSAAGSLVSHVLGFTRVCPVRNNLYFERFLNPGRTDCPDIDIDFCWRRRDEVIRFCYEHWGEDHVAMVCNINRFRKRGAIRDVARALGYPPEQVDQIAQQVRGHGPVYDLAEKLIGIPRHLGVHCGGIVITPEPTACLAPLTWSTKGVIITQYDKRAVEPAGLVKIDLLANRALSTVHDAMELIARHYPATVDIEDQAVATDPQAAQVISQGDSLGIFQSESPGMRQLVRGLRVKNQGELAIALSLIRPGPAQGGMKAEYIARHVHHKPFTYLHPSLETLLGDTYGVMLYQEDVMRIAVELAGYTVAEAAQFRSDVSKQVSSTRLQAQYEDFVYVRAECAGLDRETAENIWNQILQFAAYSFCKAHSTVYAHIAWQTAFLKARYPLAFYCSLFNNHQGMYPTRVYVWDAIRHGIQVLPPHVNHSDSKWVIEGKRIRASLGRVKGLCGDTIQTLVRERWKRPFQDLHDLRMRVRFRKGQLEPLIAVGACDGLGPSRPAMLKQMLFPPQDARAPMLFDPYDRSTDQPEFDRFQKLQAEIEITGIPFTFHPELLIKVKHVSAARLSGYVNSHVTIAGFIAAARRAKTQDNRVMGFVTLEDASGLAEVSFFPDHLELYRRIATCGGPVWIRGKVTEHLSSITIECTQCGQAA